MIAIYLNFYVKEIEYQFNLLYISEKYIIVRFFIKNIIHETAHEI